MTFTEAIKFLLENAGTLVLAPFAVGFIASLIAGLFIKDNEENQK